MQTKNQKIFEELPDSEYFKHHHKAVKKFRNAGQFQGAIGFDVETDGFIVLHEKHVDVALPEELPVCLILKKLGFGILLLNEEEILPDVDVQIGELFFEIKRVSKARNIQAAIIWQIRFAHKKAENLILHIDQIAPPETVRHAVRRGLKKYPGIRLVWLVYEKRLWQLTRADVLEGEFSLK